MTLQLLLDSADPLAWQEWMATGLFQGITTNPTLLRRAGLPCTLPSLAALSRRAFALGAQELHLQAWGADGPSLAACGQALAALEPAAVLVKLPITRAGLEAARSLMADGIRVTFTACYEVHQVLLAAAVGATYIAPYLGRIHDQGRDGLAELAAMQRALEGVGSPTRLLVASLRQPAELAALAAGGLDCFTLSPAVAAALFAVEATQQAAAGFEADAAAAGFARDAATAGGVGFPAGGAGGTA